MLKFCTRMIFKSAIVNTTEVRCPQRIFNNNICEVKIKELESGFLGHIFLEKKIMENFCVLFWAPLR